jgi:hypothetical protein
LAKVHINGEIFDFDRDRRPMSEMIALEKELGVNYGQWETDMAAGSARALAGMIWLVWRRNGRDVDFADIESGKAEIDYLTFEVENDAAPVDPTTRPGSSTTGGDTSPRSARSGSGRGKSGSST